MDLHGFIFNGNYEQAEMKMRLRGVAGLICLVGISIDADSGKGGIPVFAVAAEPQKTDRMTMLELPLRRGFYVSSDTACERASNATLGLFDMRGLNGAREHCAFVSVESVGMDRYRVVEQCTEIGSGDMFRISSMWEILTPQSFRRTNDAGWQSSMRYCEQAMLPELWRGIDLESAIVRD
jgi:hypothetical protein